MKTRLRKKLAKKRAAAQEVALSLPEEAVSSLALDWWRIKTLSSELPASNKGPVLNSYLDNMQETLQKLGVEVEDLSGADFRDGLTLKVELFENTSSLARGTRRITETLSPAIYISGRLVKPGRVIVAVGVEE